MQPRKRRVNHKKMCEMPSPFAHHKMETQAPQPSASLTHALAHTHARARNQSLTSRTSAIASIMSLFCLHVYKFSPRPSQRRGQGEGLVCSGAAAGIPHLNPRPQPEGRGQTHRSGRLARVLAKGPSLIITCGDASNQAPQNRQTRFRSSRRAKIWHDSIALFSKQTPERNDGRSAGDTFF